MAKTAKTVQPVAVKRPARVPISELNVRKAAARLLPVKLVSTEISYVQRTLGNTATQDELDAQVIAVRTMPWSAIALPD